MELAINTFINVLILSSMYILVALGFVLLFSIMGILNIAHGVIYMVGAYTCYALAVTCGLNQWLALLLTVVVISPLGLFLERFCFRPVVGDFNRQLAVCVGIILILQTTVANTMGYKVQSLPAFAPGILKAGIISVSAERLVTFLIGAALLGLIIWLINRTKPGQQMQATAQNLEGATLQGINIYRMSALACVTACGLAAVAGGLMGAYLSLGAYMGDYMLLKALILVVLGGMGSISGIFFAGLVVGGLDAILPVFMSGATSDAISLGIIIAILVFRPQGFLGHEV